MSDSLIIAINLLWNSLLDFSCASRNASYGLCGVSSSVIGVVVFVPVFVVGVVPIVIFVVVCGVGGGVIIGFDSCGWLSSSCVATVIFVGMYFLVSL